jgi:SAM-dependent methyltransferase
MGRKEHWETVYATKGVTEVSWFESEPLVSLDLIETASPAHSRIIDIGGGASVLVDRLLDRGLERVAVLDISATALERSKSRLGDRATQVNWIVADVTTVESLGQFDVWHDRAVFHFLTDPEDRRKYVELASRTIPLGGHLVIGAFGTDGPPKCSGLDVCRYDAKLLTKELGASFQLIREVPHQHITPGGQPQKFFFGLFDRL